MVTYDYFLDSHLPSVRKDLQDCLMSETGSVDGITSLSSRKLKLWRSTCPIHQGDRVELPFRVPVTGEPNQCISYRQYPVAYVSHKPRPFPQEVISAPILFLEMPVAHQP